jgi:putative endopeptidase
MRAHRWWHAVVALGAIVGVTRIDAQRPSRRAANPPCAPCTDFYGWVNHAWLTNAARDSTIADSSSVAEAESRTNRVVRNLLEFRRGLGTDADTLPTDWLPARAWAQCMDESTQRRTARASAAGVLTALDSALARGIPHAIAFAHHIGAPTLFALSVVPERARGNRLVLSIEPALGTTDRATGREDRTFDAVGHPAASRTLISRTLELLGDSPARAAGDAGIVAEIERVITTATERPFPHAYPAAISIDSLSTLAPSFDWRAFFDALGEPGIDRVRIARPDAIAAVAAMTKVRPITAWRAFLRRQIARYHAPALGRTLVSLQHKLTRSSDGDTVAAPSHAESCTDLVTEAWSPQIITAFIATELPTPVRAQIDTMVTHVRRTARELIAAAPGITDSTRAARLAKLDALRLHIGAPASSATNHADHAAAIRATFHETLALARDQPLRAALRLAAGRDTGAYWPIDPLRPYAMYEPITNSVFVTAALLTPPIVPTNADLATLYGGAGSIIAHELTHALDEVERDAQRRRGARRWLTVEDSTRVATTLRRLRTQYQRDARRPWTASPAVNAERTANENFADLGGLQLAYAAFERAGLTRTLATKPRAPLGAQTPGQRFFVAWARLYRAITASSSSDGGRYDSHAPPKWRVNEPASHFAAFAQVFGCRTGSPMTRLITTQITVW